MKSPIHHTSSISICSDVALANCAELCLVLNFSLRASFDVITEVVAYVDQWRPKAQGHHFQ